MVTIEAEGPLLQGTARTGKTKYHRVQLVKEGKKWGIRKMWWLEGSAPQYSVPRWVSGVNAGKVNATTDEEQATLTFERAIQKKRDKGASEDGSSDHVRTKPMLAHTYEGRKHTLDWPVCVQPKLDGFRMLLNNTEAWTRGGKPHVEACVAHLLWDVEDYTMDGELLLPGNVPLQQTASAAKKFNAATSPTLEYHVYDVVEPDLPFYPERHGIVKAMLANAPANVKLVPTKLCRDEAELMEAHAEFVAQGYEGSIIRTRGGVYEVGQRSNALLKLKDFQDAEFPVVGVKEGKGSNVGLAILTCETESGETFDAVPEGGMDLRRELWRKRLKVVGTIWTVRYQTLSAKGIPIFPIAVAPRNPGD